uniref:Diacylglycerol kinase accessory domain-containing protein n=1 Tax=Biomphalaria glabrata TaxID=6526 RepID=A0A2C9KBQ8_BIOGL
MMWYGVLGGKEMINQTFKNLDQRVLLECDGQRIPLPSLQGIVILNIPSYGGGANFWGGSKQDENFTAPSFDDRILEVVAVFGSMQMAMSRVIDLQHHRIAQCRTVKVTILGDEGVPVQVDGEAWIQPPGYVRIVHKNRAQMLIRDRTFENVLKSWSEKQKSDRPVSPQPLSLTEDETQVLLNFVEATSAVIRR